ncbi:tyrosine-type recombinase/integrase [Microbacterium paulum]
MIPAAATIAPTATDPVELVGFEGYLRVERHLAASTIAANVARARRFLAGYAPPEGAVALTAAEVTRALLDEGVTRRPVSVKAFGYTLRALLRFFFITGVTSHDLSAATLVIRSPQPSRLPVGASRDEVAALLVSCDGDTSAGLRDHAVLLLLAHLGLRAIEVARLRLDDLDWRRGEILVRGKGNRDERLPLPAEVGEAVVAYLQEARPAGVGFREVFAADRAPLRPLTREAVGGIVERACDRASLARFGAHRLRHTLGEQMVACRCLVSIIRCLRPGLIDAVQEAPQLLNVRIELTKAALGRTNLRYRCAFHEPLVLMDVSGLLQFAKM